MEEKKLNDNALEKVSAGAARPSDDSIPTPDFIGAVYRLDICSNPECGKTLQLPPSGHGNFTCPYCGTVNRY